MFCVGNRSANCPAKVSTHVFCAGGAADISGWWSPSVTTGTDGKIYSGAPEGRQTNIGLSPLRGWMDIFDSIQWFLHRLISGVPPGRRSIPDLCRNISWTVCATIATEASDETRSAHSLFKLVNIASDCGRSIRREGKRADAAARQPPTYCFGQRARDHCRKTCGERGDHRRGDQFEARRGRIGTAHSSPGQNAD